MDHQFRYRDIVLNYSISGKGPLIAFTFHGFGQGKSSYHPLEEVLKSKYTIYSFDLFFHGKSELSEPVLYKSLWKEIIEDFITQQSISRFTLIGYSLGGKFALATMESFPDKTDKVVLIAPDGIKVNFWYFLSTSFFLTRQIFKSTIDKPGLFKSLTTFLERSRVVDNGIIKFARTQMNTSEKRARVYKSWVGFRHLNFDINVLAQLINSNGIIIEVYIGKYDKMILAKHMKPFLKKLNQYKFEILNTGHTHLISKVAEYYKTRSS